MENIIGEYLNNNGWIVFTRTNYCDVVAWKSGIVYLIECKGYNLSKKQQINAIKELNNNLRRAKELLKRYNLEYDIFMRILVAPSFNHNSHGIYQYTPEDFIEPI